MTQDSNLTTRPGGQNPYQGLNAQLVPLPKIISSHYQPSLYADSTHQLCHLQTEQGNKVLKRLNPNAHQQAFWRNVQALFGLDLNKHLNHQAWCSTQLAGLTDLAIPQIEWAVNPGESLQGFVLAAKLNGETGQASWMNQANIDIFARHLKGLHQISYANWGVWQQPQNPLTDWPHKLTQSLKSWMNPTDHQAWWSGIKQAEAIRIHSAVPTMLDLRWDQFLFEQQQLSALVDLDAFVLAPVELSWVILEYLLDEHQAWWFAQTYGERPDLTPVREAYRLWLFSTNLLGESDLTRWMTAPTRF
ncbi:MAG: hypothetical protein IBX48_05635 [Thiomicrospira sp.]|uniref:hypothetical protein n=1 Tax=Thiomicrospira sp. TaxID=935 RepID=UPI0019E52CF0|nr:hypothetical protein [Thiomicrospira sp.]MBE0493805.1 hypothetical protein [Thiomicrospira sp.]